ncbi:conserved protein of unknown function precursor containing a T9SS type A C-terminal secretion signal [Tenacibaculum sp. 190524A02b]|uniref:T9SS type A sorting domain-containing protein n=1 Tax=Tenacibaculum vairaonense TaxID=3137860 RepID=UPI0032B1EBD9
MKVIFLPLFFYCFTLMSFAQEIPKVWCSTELNSNVKNNRVSLNDQLTWNDLKAYQKRTNYHIAVIPITYADVPLNFKEQFPTKNDWERIIFHSKIQDTFRRLSNDNFTLTGDVFDYITSNSVYWNSATNTTIPFQEVLDNMSFTLPNFDVEKYDEIVFLSCHDAALSASNVGSYSYTINGKTYSQGAMIMYYENGRSRRNTSGNLVNTLKSKKNYLIPTTGGGSEEGKVFYDLSQTEATFCHELGHSMGIGAHANSRTNGNKYDYEPEVSNNRNFYDREYGNAYDIMGTHAFSSSMNGYFREVIGLLPYENIETVNEIGTKTVTIYPINSKASKRYVEVLLPFQRTFSQYKEAGYGIEVRKVDAFDEMLKHPELKDNVEGVFVHKINGLANHLLDMSPSANINFSWGTYYDIRDVVLKPGEIYENNDVKLSNVKKNNDGSFTLDIEIKNSKNKTPAPTALNVTRLATSQLKVTWENNHLSSGNNGNVLVQYRTLGSNSWRAVGSVANNATSYTTGFGTNVNQVYEFRIRVEGTTTNLPSRASNIVATGCNLKVTNMYVRDVKCTNDSSGEVEVDAEGGVPPYQYKVEGGTYTSSDIIKGLSVGTYTIYVKDANGCEVSKEMTKPIKSPKPIVISYDLDGTDLTIKPNFGTGIYQYKLNAGSWTNNPVFENVSGDFTISVKDQNGCEVDNKTLNVAVFDEVGFKMYPNPVSDNLYISANNIIKKIKIFNLLGEKVAVYKMNKKAVKINTSDLGIGMYIVKIKTENNRSLTRKVIVE